MIEHGAPQAARYAGQVELLQVVSECTRGCPTIDLAIGDRSTIGSSLIIADAYGKSPEGVYVNVILHVRDQVIAELEIAGFDNAGAFRLPRPKDLTPW